MTVLHELIDIFCIGEPEKQIQCLDWIKTLKIHEMLQINRKLFRNFALICYISTLGDLDSLVIHIMIRETLGLNKLYDMEYSEDVEFLSTIVINKRARCQAIYDWENFYEGKDFIHDMYKKNEGDLGEQIDPINIQYRSPPDFNQEIIEQSNINTISESDLNEIVLNNFLFYKNYYIDFHDSIFTRPYINCYTNILYTQMLDDLYRSKSGLWFNEHDIRWQFSLRATILHNSNFDLNILDYTYKCFELVNVNRFYINGQLYSKNQLTNKANENLKFECDICHINLDKYAFSNINIGDLCIDCYYNKKLQFKLRIEHLKKVMLIPGRQAVFKKECEKTRRFLETITIQKLEKDKLDTLTRNVINELNKYNMSRSGNFMECPICLDSMCKNDILFGSCGHCFHANCILTMGTNKCPVCRTTTEFNKLYLQ